MNVVALGVVVALVSGALCVAADAVCVPMDAFCRRLHRGATFVVRRMFTFRSVSVESSLAGSSPVMNR